MFLVGIEIENTSLPIVNTVDANTNTARTNTQPMHAYVHDRIYNSNCRNNVPNSIRCSVRVRVNAMPWLKVRV